MEFSHRLDLFGPEIFAALNDKKVALEGIMSFEGNHATPFEIVQGQSRAQMRPHALERFENRSHSAVSLFVGERFFGTARKFNGEGQ